jgi:hypothetical protein
MAGADARAKTAAAAAVAIFRHFAAAAFMVLFP